MLVEATLDFPEEEIDFLEAADARGKLARIRERLAQCARRGATRCAAARGACRWCWPGNRTSANLRY